MTLNISLSNGYGVSSYDLIEDFSMEDLAALAMAEFGTDGHVIERVKLLKNGVDLLSAGGKRTLKECGIVNGDILVYTCLQQTAVQPNAPATSNPSTSAAALFASFAAASASALSPSSSAPSGISLPSGSAPSGDEAAKARLKELLSQLNQSMTPVREKTEEEKSEERCKEVWSKLQLPSVKANVYAKRPKLIDIYVKNPDNYELFNAEWKLWMAEEKRKIDAIRNPFSIEGQRLIQQAIDEENCNKAYKTAMETMPEAFVPIHMLYIHVMVNDMPTIAFIDTGAQISIMSAEFVERMGLTRLIDTRVRSVVKGVTGQTRMVGRVHTCELTIGGAKFDGKFDVLADRDCDVLIGLDIMSRHNCNINLKNRTLTFGESTSVGFLSDAEIKKELGNKELLLAKDFKVDPEKLKHVMSMGFTEEVAAAALRDSENEVEDAVSYLLRQQAYDAEQLQETLDESMQQ